MQQSALGEDKTKRHTTLKHGWVHTHTHTHTHLSFLMKALMVSKKVLCTCQGDAQVIMTHHEVVTRHSQPFSQLERDKVSSQLTVMVVCGDTHCNHMSVLTLFAALLNSCKFAMSFDNFSFFSHASPTFFTISSTVFNS